ncbi:hypothetical protein KT71_18272 [Congregibacter litoralis KT71]|uniref:Uncharacterized protein n=1 Tax=Congregibacter litoralis KT71 TaxID=314285 RepID=A4ADH8_9GAMM|nr:hypothetical protein KT71_18272 [Congregibacter litoralis KT71]
MLYARSSLVVHAEAVAVQKGKKVSPDFDPDSVTDPMGLCEGRENRFRVIEALKGSSAAEVVTRRADKRVTCFIGYTLNDEYLLFLNGPDEKGRYINGLCNGSRGIGGISDEQMSLMRQMRLEATE